MNTRPPSTFGTGKVSYSSGFRKMDGQSFEQLDLSGKLIIKVSCITVQYGMMIC